MTSDGPGAATPWVGKQRDVLPAEQGRNALLRDGSVVVTVQPLVTSDANRVRDVYRKHLASGAVTPLVTG